MQRRKFLADAGRLHGFAEDRAKNMPAIGSFAGAVR